MNNKHNIQQSGFTLIETLIAILILALTIGALLTLTAGGFFSIRYAKNDIVAANLLQESLEYIRNTRDTAAQNQNTDPSLPQGANWSAWLNDPSRDFGRNCVVTNNPDGCIVNPYARNDLDRVVACNGRCSKLNYFPAAGFYGYGFLNSNTFEDLNLDPQQAQPYETSFVRTIKMEPVTVDGVEQLIVTARMDWLNGTNPKSATQSITLTPWNLQ